MKESFTSISGFYWKEVFKPSFIGRLQTGITKIFGVGDRKKKYSTTKFNSSSNRLKNRNLLSRQNQRYHFQKLSINISNPIS